jgi:hypothetical protein
MEDNMVMEGHKYINVNLNEQNANNIWRNTADKAKNVWLLWMSNL